MSGAVVPDGAAALCAAAALLLIVSGAAKLVRPDGTAVAMAGLIPRARRSPRPAVLRAARLRPAARSLGVAEIVVGAVVVGLGGRFAAALLAAAYLALAGVAVRLVRDPDAVSCGCFGSDDTPASWHHVVLNVVAAAAATTAAVTGLPAAGGLAGDGTLAGVTLALLVVTLTSAAYLSITALPALTAASRSVQELEMPR